MTLFSVVVYDKYIKKTRINQNISNTIRVRDRTLLKAKGIWKNYQMSTYIQRVSFIKSEIFIKISCKFGPTKKLLCK